MPLRPLLKILYKISSTAPLDGAHKCILSDEPEASTIEIIPVIVEVLPVPGGPCTSKILF